MKEGDVGNNVGLSVVVPLFNEAESITDLYAALDAALSNLNGSNELIFVDDGSTDNSFEILKGLYEKDDRVKVIQLRGNRGKAAALAVGFRESSGGVIITLDGDLQDDPKEFPKFLRKLEEGYDMVSGWKVRRQDPWTRRILSAIFNHVTAFITGLRLHDFNCGFKAYRRAVISELKLHGELHRFIPALASWRGFRVAEIEVEHHRRKHGRSKYGMERIPGGFFDLLTVIVLTRFTAKPLHLFGLLGIFLGLAGISIIGYLSLGWFLGKWIGTRPILLIGAILVIAGIQLISLGLVAEMIVYASGSQSDPPVRTILK
ncbi:MAG: glycosyltransferase [Candidatus Methylomirabilis sp.]